jgi:predicted ATPase
MLIEVRVFPSGNNGLNVSGGMHDLEVAHFPMPEGEGAVSPNFEGAYLKTFARVGERWYLVQEREGHHVIFLRQETFDRHITKYITPTDEDAKRRPEVEVGSMDGSWYRAKLLAVIDDSYFVVQMPGCGISTRRQCRMLKELRANT